MQVSEWVGGSQDIAWTHTLQTQMIAENALHAWFNHLIPVGNEL